MTLREKEDLTFNDLCNLIKKMYSCTGVVVSQPAPKEDYRVELKYPDGTRKMIGYTHPDLLRCMENCYSELQQDYEVLKKAGIL